jgi:Polyketide cyclase / dehydrase and lipid transport
VMKVVVTTECMAPPEVAFAANLDIPNWPRFIDSVERVGILTPGPVAVGTRFRATRLIGGQPESREFKLAAMDAPWRLVFTGVDLGLRRVLTSEIVPHGSGSRLTLTFQSAPLTFGARLRGLFSFLKRRRVRKQLRRDVKDLAREADRRVGR